VPAVPVLVTTSWDDSHQLDEKLAQEFDDHGLEATFCIAPRPAEIPAIQRLTGAALGNIATRFEIGSHTLTHPHPQARVASGVCHLGGAQLGDRDARWLGPAARANRRRRRTGR
jgi:hypothetical protein